MQHHHVSTGALALPDFIASLEGYSDLNRRGRRAVLAEVGRLERELRASCIPVSEARFSLTRCLDCGDVELAMECDDFVHFVTIA